MFHLPPSSSWCVAFHTLLLQPALSTTIPANPEHALQMQASYLTELQHLHDFHSEDVNAFARPEVT